MDRLRQDGLFAIASACVGEEAATDVLAILAIDPAIDCSLPGATRRVYSK